MRQSTRTVLPAPSGNIVRARLISATALMLALLLLIATASPGLAQRADHKPTTKYHILTAVTASQQSMRAKQAAAVRHRRQVHLAAVYAHRLAQVRWHDFLARLPAIMNLLTLYSLRGPSPWDGVARCETGSNWTMQGATFSGGLGFANSTWDTFVHGQTPSSGRLWNDLVSDFGYPQNAGQASREQQIVVANRIRDWNHGTAVGAWGCGWAYGH